MSKLAFFYQVYEQYKQTYSNYGLKKCPAYHIKTQSSRPSIIKMSEKEKLHDTDKKPFKTILLPFKTLIQSLKIFNGT